MSHVRVQAIRPVPERPSSRRTIPKTFKAADGMEIHIPIGYELLRRFGENRRFQLPWAGLGSGNDPNKSHWINGLRPIKFPPGPLMSRAV